MYQPFATRRRNTLRALLFLAGLALLPACAGHTAPPASNEPVFLFGADWPVNGSADVKALFYETGCNFVRVTGGGYGWASESHKKALQELSEHDIKVLLQLGSHYPDAKYFEFKDSYLIDQAGETGKEDRNAWAINYSGSNWPQYSYASDTFRKQLPKDFTAYLDGLKDATNVNALLLHNEPGYHWLDNRMFDYNPQSIAKFRAWLPKQHGTIDNLNKRWGTSFASFDTVEPPKELSPVKNLAGWLDWRRFNADLIQDFLKEEVAFAHKVRPSLPTTTNLSGPLDNWYPIRVGDNYRYTADFDIAGIDIYPNEWTSPVFTGYTMDMTRGAAQGKKLYVAETEVFGPERFAGLSEEQRAGMLRSEVWTLIGHGADAVLLWSLAGQEGFRLTEGKFNERVAVTREIGHLSPMLHLGTFKKPTANIAVCVDQDSYVYYGGQKPKLEGSGVVDQAARGMYTAVVAGQHQADVVSAAQIRRGIGKKYQALFLSMPVLMDAELATALKAFVAGGGLLVTEAPFAERDRWGGELAQSPGFGFDEVFGIQNVKPNPTDGHGITTAMGVFAGGARTQFTVTTAKVMGTFGDDRPAVMVNTFGKGTAIYIAAEVGQPNAFDAKENGEFGFRTFITSILSKYAREEPFATLTYQGKAPAFLDSALRQDAKGNQLLVLANPSDHAKPLPPVTQVSLKSSTAMLPVSAQVFAFPPTRRTNGRTEAGPVAIAPTGNTLTLPDVSDALPVLITRDFTPLLTIDAPVTAEPESDLTVNMTCYNPSAKPLKMIPTLILPDAWKFLSEPKPVIVAAKGKRVFSFRVRSFSVERSVIKGKITYLGSKGTETVISVPVDVDVKFPDEQ